MTKKVYKIKIAIDTEKEGYSPNIDSKIVLAESAMGAMAKVELEQGEVVDEIEFLAEIDLE